MDYKENIKYRYFIEKKAYASEKLTDSEKWWIRSNPEFNPKFDFPCYKSDVINIPENRDITVTVTALSYGDKTKIYRPAIGVVGKGTIKVNGELFDIERRNVDYKETRILIPMLDRNRTSTSHTVFSKSGLMSIWYQCEYYDERMRAYTIEMSDGAKLSYGMKKSILCDNEFIYYCKSPTVPNDAKDAFNAFVFSVKIYEP